MMAFIASFSISGFWYILLKIRNNLLQSQDFSWPTIWSLMFPWISVAVFQNTFSLLPFKFWTLNTVCHGMLKENFKNHLSLLFAMYLTCSCVKKKADREFYGSESTALKYWWHCRTSRPLIKFCRLFSLSWYFFCFPLKV